jgi:large subunit ribosomal protein L33
MDHRLQCCPAASHSLNAGCSISRQMSSKNVQSRDLQDHRKFLELKGKKEATSLVEKQRFIMAKKGAREKIKMKSSESNECYWTTKNKRNVTERIELKKYDKSLRRHVMFKEAK